MTDLVDRGVTGRAGPADASYLPPEPRPPSDGAPATPPAGVELHRLLARARLSSAQALEIGAGVLAGAAELPEPGSPGSAARPAGRVVLGADGLVRVGSGGGAPGAATGPELAAVLADVAAAARRRGPSAQPVPDPLLAELDRAVAELPVAGVPTVARRLQEAVAAIDRGTVRAELAALVRAVRGDAPPHAGGPGTGGRPPAARAAPSRRPTGGRTGTGLRRLGAWTLSVLLLAGVVLLELTTLRDRIAGDVRELLDAGRSGPALRSSPAPDGRPVPSFAPAAAGAVTAVDLRPLAACAPGAPCDLRVLVQLAPAPDQRVVAWSYRVVDRCTGASYAVAGGSVPVPAAGDRAAAVGVVPLPELRSVAVVAVTDLPATAASAPVVVGSCRSGP